MASRNVRLENPEPSNYPALLDQMFDRVNELVMEVILSGLKQAPRFVLMAVREAFENSGIFVPDDEDDESMEAVGPPAARGEGGILSGSGQASEETSDDDQLSATYSLNTIEKGDKVVELLEYIEHLCYERFEEFASEQASNVDDADKMEE